MKNRLKVLRAERDWSQGDLAERLAIDTDFPLSREEIQNELDPMRHIGRSVEQTERFLERHPVPESTPLQEIRV